MFSTIEIRERLTVGTYILRKDSRLGSRAKNRRWKKTMGSGDHLSETTLEAYAMNSLTAEAELAACEEHLLVCHACQDRAAEWDRFVGVVTRAMELAGTYHVHHTEDGPVLIIPGRSEGRYTAALEGFRLCSGTEGETQLAALDAADTRFREMFPEHRCGPDCGWRMRDSQIN